MRKTDFSYISNTLTAELPARGGQRVRFGAILHNTPYAPFANQCFQWVSNLVATCCAATKPQVARAPHRRVDMHPIVAFCFSVVGVVSGSSAWHTPFFISANEINDIRGWVAEIYGADPPPRQKQPAALSSV